MQQFTHDLQKGALIHRMHDFLSVHSVMVLSTVGKGNLPESAILEYAVSDDLSVYFCTSKESRKYDNLVHYSSKVSVVVGFYEERTMQYEGEAVLLRDNELSNEMKKDLMTRGKRSHKPSGRDFIYFRIDPSFIRLTNVAESPWQVQEVTLSEN